MFYGGRLERPVFVTDTMVVHDLEKPTSLRAGEFRDRSYLEVAMFWGPAFKQYLDGQKPLSELTLDQAGQHGRLYPAVGDAPAVLLQTIPNPRGQAKPVDLALLEWGGPLPPGDVDTLVKFGVPARQPER